MGARSVMSDGGREHTKQYLPQAPYMLKENATWKPLRAFPIFQWPAQAAGSVLAHEPGLHL